MHVQKYYVWLALLCCSLSAQVQAGQKVKTSMHLPNTPDAVARPFMQEIPAGDFLVGSPSSEEGRDDDEAQHRVQVAAFELGETEVTVGQFRAFVEDRGYVTDAQRNAGNRKGCGVIGEQKREWVWKEDYNWKNPGYIQTEEHPVVCVSWHDTQAYIKWLNQQTGQQYRLPSEAEWRYATNAKGLHWHGNVWEWVQDCWHNSYDGAPSDGRAWLTGGNCDRRVLRGGPWDIIPVYLRAVDRSWSNADDRSNVVGFRLARTL